MLIPVGQVIFRYGISKNQLDGELVPPLFIHENLIQKYKSNKLKDKNDG